MNVHAEAYCKFIENQKIDDHLVDDTIKELNKSPRASQGVQGIQIYEWSSATDPVNWILYIRSAQHSFMYVFYYELITKNDKESFPHISLLIQKWYEYSKNNANLAIQYMRFVSKSDNISRIEQKNGLGKGKINAPLQVLEAMPLISKDSNCSLNYAMMIGKRFVEGEKSIFKNAKNTLLYLKEVLGGEIPEDILEQIEESVSRDPISSLYYALNYKKGPFPLGEKAIACDGDCSLRYARDVIHSRFELGEAAISTRDDLLLSYSLSVLGTELPDKMHKKMSLKTFASV
jgi:hypothetical protein